MWPHFPNNRAGLKVGYFTNGKVLNIFEGAWDSSMEKRTVLVSEIYNRVRIQDQDNIKWYVYWHWKYVWYTISRDGNTIQFFFFQ